MAVLFNILALVLSLYEIALLLRVVSSWMQMDPYSNQFIRFLYQVTEPLLEPIRAILPPMGMIDFSPMLAMFLLLALQRVLSILANSF